jgi:DNA-binding response OmpR family regulator
MSERILLIEDDQRMAMGLQHILLSEGFAVELAADGRAGLAAAERRDNDLLILDAMLPGLDGWEVLRTLRARGNHVPVLMLTARAAEDDKVRGLELGADDYVTKPFGIPELVARVRARLRRAGVRSNDADIADFPGLSIDFARQIVRASAGEAEMSTHESALLRRMILYPGKTVTRAQLLTDVWGDECAVTTRVVDWQVANLRKKIEQATGEAEPRRIITVHGSGYKFVP